MARTAAWVRSDTPSLERMLLTCAFTVLTLKRRFWAIWGLVCPWLSNFNTSTSLGVRLSICAAPRDCADPPDPAWCAPTGGYWLGCQGFVPLSVCFLRCILWRLSGCSSRSLLTTTLSTTLPRQPSEQPHRQLLVQRRLSFQRPPHRTQEPLPTRVLKHIAHCPCLHRLEEVVGVLVHGHHHHAGLWHLLLDLPGSFQAIHHGHSHVHEDQVWHQFSADI